MKIFQCTVIFLLIFIQNCCCAYHVTDLLPHFDSEEDVLHNSSNESTQILEIQTTEDNLKAEEFETTELTTESNEAVQEEDHNRNDTLENEIGPENGVNNHNNSLKILALRANDAIDPIFDTLKNSVVTEESSSEQKQDKKRSSIFNSFFSEESRSDPNSLINRFFNKKFYTATTNQKRNFWPEENNESWIYDCDTENWNNRAVAKEEESWGSPGDKNKQTLVVVHKTPEDLHTNNKIQHQYENKKSEHRHEIKEDKKIEKHHISKRPGVETIYEICPDYLIELPLPEKHYNFKNENFGTNYYEASKINIKEETNGNIKENNKEIIFNLLPYYEKKPNFSENIYSQHQPNSNVLPLIEEKQKEQLNNYHYSLIKEQIGYNLLPHYDRKNNFHDKLYPLLGYHTESQENKNSDSISFQQNFSQKTQEEQLPIQQGEELPCNVDDQHLPQPQLTPAFVASDISATQISSGFNSNPFNNNFYYVPQELQSNKQTTGAGVSTATATYQQHNLHEYRVPTSLPQGSVYKNVVNYFPVTLNQYPEQPTQDLGIKNSNVVPDQVYSSYGVHLVNQIPEVVSSYQYQTLGANMAAYGQNFVVDSRPTLGYQVGVVQNPVAFQNTIRLENPVAGRFVQVPLNFKNVQEYVRVFGSPVVYTTLG